MTDETVPPKSAPHSGQWKKGQSGNPKGRPPGRPSRASQERVIAQMDPNGNGQAVLDQMNFALAKEVLRGNMAAYKEWFDRYEGKVPTPIGGTDELGPIQAIVTGVIREGDE